jgi:hypothetical protein
VEVFDPASTRVVFIGYCTLNCAKKKLTSQDETISYRDMGAGTGDWEKATCFRIFRKQIKFGKKIKYTLVKNFIIIPVT